MSSHSGASSTVTVERPSPYTGVAKALRAAYLVPKLPAELARLLAKLS